MSELIESLTSLERKLLSVLGGPAGKEELAEKSRLSQVEVNRAIQWLLNKGLVLVKEKASDYVDLGPNGKLYRKKGLPERRFLSAIGPKSLSLEKIARKAGLTDDETRVSLGLLKSGQAIVIGPGLQVTVTPSGKRMLGMATPEENLLKRSFPVAIDSLPPGESQAAAALLKRKNILQKIEEKQITVELTAEGRKAKEAVPSAGKVIDRLEPDMLIRGTWKGKKFRRFDMVSPVPRIFGGRKQPYRRFLEEIRQHFLSLGFTEMAGPIVETDFWNMDALFMPQDHSARDIHDAYYIKEPKFATDLPRDLINKVRLSHERGAGTGSRGWRYKFDVRRTYRHVLRTQDTSISPRILSSPELKIPGKYFQMVRCFRYDVVDSSHLPDFNQVGGFVVEEGITFQHLIGLLKLITEEFAENNPVKITPAYFPFTEPSAALYAKHPELGWIELAGSGIFRPEMCAPLGVKEPVIAWGLGVERIAMFRLGVQDIRKLFSHDLEFLRSAKVI